MLEVKILSLLIGTVGWQAVVVSGWLNWRQLVSSKHHQEEEEILTCFESREDSASVQPQQVNGRFNPKNRTNQIATDPQLVGWEFKIVRSSRDLFHDPAIFQRLCEEEAISGWILLEKLDDRRVRFKRLIALREVIDAQQLPLDPYRTHYGSHVTPLTWLGAIAALIAIAVPSYFGYALVSTMLNNSEGSSNLSPQEQIPADYQRMRPQAFPPSSEE
ncbi:MAG: hypothetical protein WA919_30235 [Coleofasciculaceae cyanobacterium]